MMLLVGVTTLSAQREAAVRGTVRDGAGVPQMGVAVQLVGADARVVAAAFTDLSGHYALRHIVPGVYQLRATATLYLPAVRSHLQLRGGELPMVNVTLRGLLDEVLLPVAKTSGVDQPDDWRWTLRSSANRPLLRALSSGRNAGSAEAGRARSGGTVQQQVLVRAGEGSFGGSGVRTVLQRRQASRDGSGASLARFEAVDAGRGVHAVEVAGVIEGSGGAGSVRRAGVRLRSLPQVTLGDESSGTAVFDAAGGERIVLGDVGMIEAGTLVRVVHAGQTTLQSYPFLRAETQVGGGWTIGYGLATNADCQRLDDVGASAEETPAVGRRADALQIEQGLHQTVSARHKMGPGVFNASFQHDDLRTVAISGSSGENWAAGLVESVLQQTLRDRTSGRFRQLTSGYAGDVLQISVTYPLARSSELTVEYASGEALSARHGAVAPAGAWKARQGQAVHVAVQTAVSRTGTRVRAGYAWQPDDLVTAIAPYSGAGNGHYLSLHIRQSIHARHVLPAGAEVSVDGENLAREGYVTVAGGDTIEAASVAGVLRSVQAGLSFTF